MFQVLVINQNKKSRLNNSIKHYFNKHGDIPIWVLIDYLDFGEMNTLLSLLPVSIQNTIAKDIVSFVSDHIRITKPFTPEIMNSFLGNIREVRNVCAHNNRLLDFRCKADEKYFSDLHSIYNISANDNRSDVYNVFLSLQCFLSKNQYAQLHNALLKRINRLDNKISSIPIKSELGNSSPSVFVGSQF